MGTVLVAGDIVAREIVIYGNIIEDGACFKGSIEIEGSATEARPDPNTYSLAEKDFKMKSMRSADFNQ